MSTSSSPLIRQLPLRCLKLSSKLKCVTCRILVSSNSTMKRLILSLSPAIILTKSIIPLGALVTKENQNNISWRKTPPSYYTPYRWFLLKIFFEYLLTVSALITIYTEKALETHMLTSSVSEQVC